MTFLEATVAGVVQGMTEFLPISSSGHLVLLHSLFGFQEPKLLFDLVLHVGTTAAVAALFWRSLLGYAVRERPFLYLVVLGTVPTAVMGVLFGKWIAPWFSEPRVVGWGFWATALWLWVGERFKPAQKRPLTWWAALLIGTSQGVAMVPGISRSGVTIATGLLLGLEAHRAVQYSFFLLVPAVAGGFLYHCLAGEAFGALPPVFGREGILFGVGALFAMGFGMLAMRLVLRLAERKRLHHFGLYLFGMGLVSFLLSGRG